MQNNIEQYLTSREKELLRIISVFNRDTRIQLKQLVTTDTFSSSNPELDDENVQDTIKTPDIGAIESEAQKLLDQLENNTNKGKKRKQEQLSNCTHENKSGIVCGKKGRGIGESGKNEGKVLCCAHWNQSRRKCSMKGCTLFAHKCTMHDNNNNNNI